MDARRIGPRAIEAMGHYTEYVGGRHQRAEQHAQRPRPVLRLFEQRLQQQPFGQKAAAGRQAHQAAAGHGERGQGDRHVLTGALHALDPLAAENGLQLASGKKHRHLGQPMGQHEQPQRRMQPRLGQMQQQAEGQQRIAQLGNRGIGHQRLQPRRAQRRPATGDQRQHPGSAEQQAGVAAEFSRGNLAPDQPEDVQRPLDHQRRKQRADRCRRRGVGRRQPQVQRPERGLEHQPHAHQQQRQMGRAVGLAQARQQGQIEQPVAPVEQRHTEQVGQRAGQRQQQIVQRRLPGFTPGQRHQRHGHQTEQFQGHVEVEQIGRQPQRRQRRMQQAGQRPVVRLAGGMGDARGIQRHQQVQPGGEHQQQRGQRRQAETNRQPGLPATDEQAAFAMIEHHLQRHDRRQQRAEAQRDHPAPAAGRAQQDQQQAAAQGQQQAGQRGVHRSCSFAAASALLSRSASAVALTATTSPVTTSATSSGSLGS